MMMGRAALFTALLAAVVKMAATQAFGAGTGGAVIHSVSPSNGSIAGGTLVTILGSGFQRGGIVGGTNVFLGHLECPVINYWSSDEKLICTAAEMHNFSVGYSYMPVRVAMHSLSAASFAQGAFQYKYWDTSTPFIRRSSAGVLAGGDLQFGGLLRAATTDDITVTIGGFGCSLVNEYIATNEEGVDITAQIQLGLGRRRRSLESATCSSGPEVFVDTLPTISLDTFSSSDGSVDVDSREVAEDSWDDVDEACTLPTELEAGRYNYSVAIAASRGYGFGHAKFFERSRQSYGSADIVSVSDAGAHVVTVYPVITALSTQFSGSLGGQAVQITGRGFSETCTENVVELAGAPCQVVSCTTTAIVCTVANSSDTLSAGPYPGTTGLTERFWDTFPSSMDFAASLAAYASPTNEGVGINGIVTTELKGTTTRRYASEQVGVFVPPHTADYRFWVMGDDHAQIELNAAGDDPAGLAVVASVSGRAATGGTFSTSSYNTRLSQKSAPIALVAGQRYAFRSRHANNAGAGYTQAAVEVVGAPATAIHPQYHRVNERQQVMFTSVVLRQIQRITVHNTSGGVLELLGGSAGPYNFTVSSTGALSGAVNAVKPVVSGCNSFTVTTDTSLMAAVGTLTISVRFNCNPQLINNAVSPWPLLRISTADLDPFTPSRRVTGLVENLQNPSDPMLGSFSITLAGISTPASTIAISHSASTMESRIRTALRSFPTVQEVVVDVTGDTRYAPRITVDFMVPQAFDFPPIEFDLSATRGTNVSVAVSTEQNGAAGSILYDPIPARFFELSTGLPATIVTSNGIRAACNDPDGSECSFQYDPALTPTVTRVTSSAGTTVVQGDVLTITGTALRVNSGAVTVDFGGSSCAVTSHTSTQILCTVGHATRGTYLPTVTVEGTGRASTTGAIALGYGFSVASVGPVRTGYRGGGMVYLTGTGFSRDGPTNDITVGGARCVVAADPAPVPSMVACTLPELSALNFSATGFTALVSETTANLVVGFFDDHTTVVTYASALTPSVTSITPSELSAAITTNVTLFGRFEEFGFMMAGAGGCAATMDFVSPSGATRPCTQLAMHEDSITCILVRGPAFSVAEQAATFPRLQLCANVDGSNVATVVAHPEPPYGSVDLALRVTSVSPQTGSLAGGTLITIEGAGFADDSARIVRSALTYNYLTPMVVVNLTLSDRNVPCLLTSSNFTTIECTTVFPTSADVVMVASPPAVYQGGGYNAEVAVSVNDVSALGCVDHNLSGGGGPTTPSVDPVDDIVYVPGSGSFCSNSLGNFCVAWAPSAAVDTIEFTLTGDTSGYLALGVADTANAMGPSDVMMCWVRNGVAAASDRFNPQRGVNTLDLSQDVTLVSGNVTGSTTACTFTRPLAATDAHDRAIPAGSVNLIWAMGPLSATEDTPSWHGLQTRGSMALTLLETLVVANEPDSGSGSGEDVLLNGTYTPLATGGGSAYTAVVHTFAGTIATSCSFNYANASTPRVSTLAPAEGAGETTVTLSGTGFDVEPIVFVGESEATVSSFSAASITVIIPAMTAGMYFVRVQVPGAGLAAHPTDAPIVFRSLLALTSVQPSISSLAGGLVITYSGAGFSPQEAENELVINGIRAHVIDAQHDTLVAVTPQVAGSSVVSATVELTVPTVQIPAYHFGQLARTSSRYSGNVSVPSTGAVPMVGGMLTLPSTYAVVDAAAITYTSTATPVITSVFPVTGAAGDSITVTGQNLEGSNVTEVLVGAESCQISSLNATHAVCTLGSTSAGLHRVFVTVHGLGTASGDVTFTASLQITGISSASGSFGGGTIVTISGSGFGGGSSARRTRRQADGAWGGWIIYDTAPEDALAEQLGTRITLCGLNCTVNSSSYSDVVCETPKLTSPESIAAFNSDEIVQLQSDTYVTEFATNSQAALAFDYDFSTAFTAGSWVGLDFGADARAIVSRVRFFPGHQRADLFIGATFETSLDGATWNQLQENTPVTPHQGWNWANFEIVGQAPSRFVRMVSLNAQMYLGMMEVYGHSVSPLSACPVTVHTTAPLSHPALGLMTTDHATIASLAGPAFTYAVGNTPIVTSVSPRFGSSLGGDRITITGTNLATSIATAEIKFSGVECAVLSASVSGDSIECVTGRRGPIARHNSVPLSLTHKDLSPGRGFAIVNESVRFRFLDRWSAVNTWLNDEPPIDGDSVIIPIDQTILLDVQPPRLFLLLVQGALVFDRINVNLDASYILVQGGLMEIGTEDEPFLNTTTITLHGDRRRSIELPFIGAKVLAVADRGGFTSFGNGSGAEVPESQRGVLDIHGRPRIRTWTKVAVGVYPGGTYRIVTSEPTDFAPGEKIVITAPHQEMTVAARIDEYTFDTVEPIACQHTSEWYNHTGEGGTYELDMRFEVALLTRNVVVQGAGGPRADGSPTITEGDGEDSSVSQLYGVHTGAFHGGYYRLENAEFRHCGQAGVLGRYCMHFHRVGDAPPPNSYLKSNSIHHSFQRATTVHGTHHALVQNNVAYHVMGHTYFVEDGDETFNVFDNNIGIFTKPSHMMLKSDKQPATFWTAIPTNLWRNNVASDSSARGAWFELTDQGITLEFRNNSFHHNSGIGFRNYPNYSPPAPQWFHNNSYFRNGGNGLFYKQGGDNHHVYSKFAENGVDLFWKKYKISNAAVERNIPNVQDCIFWGGRGAQAVFAPQHEFWAINGSTFINYDDNQASGVLSGCAGCCSANSMRQGAYTYRSQRLHWINSTKRTHWTCPYKQIMYDLDGSLTGSAGGTALPFYKFNEWADGCFNDSTGDYDKGGWAPGGMVCNGSLRVRRLQLQGQEPEELDRIPISFKKSEMALNTTGGLEDIWGGINWTRYTETGVLYDGACYAGNGAPDWIPADFSGCDVMDSLDWINYRTCNSDFSGWAIPLVAKHDYNADLDWHVDFQQLALRWTEPFYLTEPANIPLVDEESVMLKWPYVDYRYRYRVEWDGTYNNSDSLPWTDRSSSPAALTRSDPFGTGRILREDDSMRTTGTKGEWDIAINPWDGINLTSGSNPMKLSFQALQCGPNMCGLPGDIPTTWPAPRYWSDPQTWVAIARESLNTITVTPTGVAPVAGEHVEIPQGMYVIMDVNPPNLGKLVVVGRLKFGGDAQTAATAATNRQLSADRILVWGILEVGDSPSSPFPGTAEIMLTGIRTSPTLVATDQHFLGNKNLVIFGFGKIYGTQRPATWTTLASTANPGATSVTLSSDPTGWAVGDKIMLAPTEYPQPVAIEQQAPGFNMSSYAATQMEEREITAIAGRTLTFGVPLAYRHFAGSIDTGAGYSVELRAHVGVLSSNVVIKGDLTATPVAGQPNWYQGYGGHVVVGEVNYGSASELAAARRRGETLGTVQKLGSFDAANVEFRDMGKLASEHGALNYRYFSNLRASDYPLNRVANCVFRSTWNHAVYTDKSFGVEIVGNAIQNTFYSGVQIDSDSRGTRIDNNLLVANQRSPDQYSPRCVLDQSCWVHPFSAFHIENAYITSVSGNVAAGAEDTGFTLYPVDACSTAVGSRKIRNNEAYGALVGVFLLDVTASNQNQCRVLDGFKAWKNAHIGVLTVDQSVNLQLQRVHVADNHEGISLNYVKAGGINHFSSIVDSSVLGSTAASTCSASLACRALSPGDLRGLTCGSEFGNNWRRVGIVMPQYTNLPKTCARGGIQPCRPVNVVNRPCSLPWENRFGNVDIQHATMNISNTAFRFWATQDCGKTSRAIQINPSQPDFTPVVYASGLTWNDYDATSRFVLSDVSHQTREATACRTGSCDAVNYFTVEDLDGSTHGAFWDNGNSPGPVTLLSAHNAPASDSRRCRTDAAAGTFVCKNATVGRVILESNPPRFTHRRVGPVTVRRYGAAASDERVMWSVGPFPQGCSCQKHFAQFTFQAMSNHTYDINSTGVLEDMNRLSFPHPDPNFCILVKIFFSRPNPVRVTVGEIDGPEVPRIMTGIRPTTTDANPSGANLMDPQSRQLFLKLCGGTSQQWWLVYENRVMVSATLSMTSDEFFGATESNQRDATETFVRNIATLLGILPSQIRVTCVHPINDPVCLGPGGRRSRRSGPPGLVVDMIISPFYTIQDVSTTTNFGPNGTNVTATYITNETVTDANRTAQLEDIFDFFENNQTDLIAGLADLPGNFTVLTFDVDWEQSTTTTTTSSTMTSSTYTTTTTINGTLNLAAAGSSEAIPIPILGGAVALLLLLILIAAVVMRRRQRPAPKEPSVYYDAGLQNPTLDSFQTIKSTDFDDDVAETAFPSDEPGFNPAFDGLTEEPSYFARNRAELVQDSLMIRVAKAPTQAGYLDTAREPEVEVQVDPSAGDHIRPSALQHTEEPTWQPVPMSPDGRLSFVSGSVVNKSNVPSAEIPGAVPEQPTLRRKPSVYDGFNDDEDGLPGVTN